MWALILMAMGGQKNVMLDFRNSRVNQK
jgi:hypothetical protein